MPLDLDVGSTFAGHRIDEMAGRGGMGVVYRATDLALDRPVALKLIAPDLAEDPVFRKRFGSECKMAAALDHPNVVEVFHAGEEDGVLYVTMRFVEGTDLGSVLHAEGKLDPARAVAMLGQVADALDEAHRHGMVHRDVKPPNVLLKERNGLERAYLTDFGLSRPRDAEDELSLRGFVMGTANYMSPELACGAAVDGRSDIYALACVLFRAVAGSAPFERETDVEVLFGHLHDPIPTARSRNPELPPALDDALHRALAKDREQRYPTAGEFAADCQAALRQARLRAVVADDSLLVRAGVVRLLEDAGVDVVAEAGDGEELMQAVREHHPDIALVDIRMPPSHTDEGMRAAKTIRAEAPDTAVLVLSADASEQYALELLESGAEAVGYLLKERVVDPEGFVEAVRHVADGGSALDPEVVGRMLHRRRADGSLATLSGREREVLSLMAEGQADDAIAAEIGVSERVVEREADSIFTKLGLPAVADASRRTQAVLTYLQG